MSGASMMQPSALRAQGPRDHFVLRNMCLKFYLDFSVVLTSNLRILVGTALSVTIFMPTQRAHRAMVLSNCKPSND